MQHKTSLYFQKLMEKASPRSMSISQAILSKKLKLVQLESIINANPQVNEQNNQVSQSLLDISRQKQYKQKTEASRMIREESPRSFLVIQDSFCNNKIIKEGQLKVLREARAIYSLSLKNASSTLERLKLQKEIAATIRKEQQIKRWLDQYSEQKKKQQAVQLEEQQEILNKRIMIAQKLNKISIERQKRTQLLSAKSSPVLPRYKVMVKKFMMNQIKEEIQRSMYLKRLKQLKLQQYAKSIDKGLRRHKNESNQHRRQIDGQTSREDSSSKRQMFEQRRQKMQLLQEKIKHMKITVNHQKQHQLEILKDKTINPYKYTYLRMKQLTDQQIYTEFKDFQLNIDSNILGNDYLQESKQRIKTQASKIKEKKRQVNNEKSQAQAAKKSYSSRIDRGRNIKKTTRIDEIMKQSDCKSKLIMLLNEESDKRKRNMQGLKDQLQMPKHYEQLLKLEADIDLDYLNYLKTKIVSLQIQAKK